MAVQSRSRAAGNSDSSSASTNNPKHASKPAKAPASDRHARQQQAPTNHHTTTPSFNDDGPPAKRRKLSIRTKPTAFDHDATAPSAPPKPPTRVTVAHPHGRLLQRLNGVQTILDTNEDDLSQPASGVATPTSRRVPRPALQLATDPAKLEDKRTLRSQDDGPRLKSELSIYFPTYEDIIFDAPNEPEFITVDSALYVTEDPTKPKPEQTSPPKGGRNAKASPSHTRKTSANGIPPPGTPRRSSSNQFNGSPSLNLEMIARGIPQSPEDPLTDEHFLKSHRRAERKEKQLRNIEKERAMHEKVQLDRILEGLQGHDWLKVLGITGITDGEAKKYEPKRDYFIAEVKTLVDKFKQWREQERRQKVEKETPVPMKEEEEEDEESDEPESEESSVGPRSSDLNASAARQLQQETAIALKSLATSKSSSSKGKEPGSSAPNNPRGPLDSTASNKPPPSTLMPPPPEVPFTSFYSKPHLRDAALGKARHGRNVTAFGHPVPEIEAKEFELPSHIVSEDAIRANAREKRRRKRESVSNASG